MTWFYMSVLLLFVVFIGWGTFFFLFVCFFGTGGPPETPMASGSLKTLKDQKSQTFLEVILSPSDRLEAWTFALIFQCFFEAALGRHFANFVRQMAPKGGPEGTISKFWGVTGGNVKAMVSFERNHQFEGWRSPARHLVKHFACNVFQSAFRNEFFTISCRFGAQRRAHWGTLIESFSLIFACFFKCRVFNDLGGAFGRGRRQGRGLYKSLICNVWVQSCHALLPLRGAANLKASPLPPAPCLIFA